MNFLAYELQWSNKETFSDEKWHFFFCNKFVFNSFFAGIFQFRLVKDEGDWIQIPKKPKISSYNFNTGKKLKQHSKKNFGICFSFFYQNYKLQFWKEAKYEGKVGPNAVFSRSLLSFIQNEYGNLREYAGKSPYFIYTLENTVCKNSFLKQAQVRSFLTHILLRVL